MNAAIIIAGGVGSRMNMDVPKQFIHIYGKPVIIYTLEGFQRHPEIDAIEVVCLSGWEETLKEYAAQYGITKRVRRPVRHHEAEVDHHRRDHRPGEHPKRRLPPGERAEGG